MGLSIEDQREKIRGTKEKTKPQKKMRTESSKQYTLSNMLVRGIYFLYKKGKIVYVGQSRDNVIKRIYSHHDRREKDFDKFSFIRYIGYTDKQLDQAEKKLIVRHKPKYNKIHKSPKKHKSVWTGKIPRKLAKEMNR